jgi:hypothetical protein
MSLFEKGRPKSGGRLKGARNKLGAACLKSALAAYEKHGDAAWEILAQESPRDFIKCIIALAPAELEITTDRLSELNEEELDVFIEYAKRLVPHDLEDVGSREDPTTH